jgi:hypothetical protein
VASGFRFLKRIFALFLLVIAALMVIPAVLKLFLRSKGDEESDEVTLVTLWGGTKLRSTARAFRGGTILTWWGGTELDLREAALAEDGADLRITNLWGGAKVIVPPGCPVESGGVNIMAGLHPPDPPSEDVAGPPLRVHATVVFGGVAIERKAIDELDPAAPEH